MPVSYTHLDVYKRQGYTNAGKSTLLNAFIDKYEENEEKKEDRKVMAKNMLFATLDTTCLLYTSRCV